MAGNLIKIIKEGQVQLQVPRTVFYNPVQEFNRDLSVLVLRTYLKHNVWHHRNEEKHVKGRGGMKILDALSASGMRSIRYAKELGSAGNIVKKIVANDLSEVAVDLIKKNIELNDVHDKVISSHSDAIHLLHLSSTNFDERFHVIDLDPFGTAAQFFDAAVRSIGEGGLLMVTCTDTAVLCGNASETCFARYGSMSLRADFCHDAALRIVLRSIESHASVYGKYIKPLLSVSVDFYVRLFLQVFTQQAETKKSASKLSQVYLCKECKTPEFNPLGSYTLKEDPKQANSKNLAVKYRFKPAEVILSDKCKICGGKYAMGGPIWSGPIHDKEFLTLVKQELTLKETPQGLGTFKRIQGIVYVCSEELENPLFYSINHMSSVLRMKMPRTKDIMSALMNAGYKVSSTHTNQSGLKTNAPSTVVWDIFCQIAEKENLNNSTNEATDTLAYRIIKRPRDKVYDFTHNPAIEAESQALSLLRFQVNPFREWGPKPRPSAKETIRNESEGSDANLRTGSVKEDALVSEKDSREAREEEEEEAGGHKKRKLSSETNDTVDLNSR